MLRAGPRARESERDTKPKQPAGKTGQSIAKRGKCRTKRQNHSTANSFGEAANGNLQSRHRTGVEASHQAKYAVAEGELSLPDRQQHVDQVGIPVVQGVREARDDERAPRMRMSSGRAGIEKVVVRPAISGLPSCRECRSSIRSPMVDGKTEKSRYSSRCLDVRGASRGFVVLFSARPVWLRVH